jgi:hypothetical protein
MFPYDPAYVPPYDPSDPCQPVHGRWLRASFLVKNGRQPTERDDAWVGRAAAFLEALGRCTDEDDRRRLAERMPAVVQAHTVYTADPPLLRWAVEARILARESFADIARKCALVPEAVEAYEALFFTVRDRLDAETWIWCRVVGAKGYYGLTEHDLDVLWKMIGYGFGPLMLDAHLHLVPGLPLPPPRILLPKYSRRTPRRCSSASWPSRPTCCRSPRSRQL